MSVQLCDEIQNPGQKYFKLNHASFVNLLKITETWIIQEFKKTSQCQITSLRET